MEKLFVAAGLSESKALETSKNAKLARNLSFLINSYKAKKEDVSSKITLLYHMASKMREQQFELHAPLVLDYLLDDRINTEARLNFALDHLLKLEEKSVDDVEAFEKACGVGVVVTPEQIEAAVESAINNKRDELIQQRYAFNLGALMSDVKRQLSPFADGKAVKNELDMQILDLLGPKTEEDRANAGKKGKEKKKKEEKGNNKKKEENVKKQNDKEENVKKENDKEENVKKVGESDAPREDTKSTSTQESMVEVIRQRVRFHSPGQNHTSEGYVVTSNYKQLIADHLKRTGGKVITRFPPEPNGVLHIGHAKAISINFGYAEAHNGECLLRFDDTNPEKEEERFVQGIKDVVHWLGHKPSKITHSSDYFDQLYSWAKDLIMADLAYVCHQRSEEVRGFNAVASPWRDRPISESLQLFEDMRKGKFDEGEATLRLKLTLEEGKQDPVAYRVRFAHHHQTKDKWCIYPTYDYTHCLVDSLEDITHSLCTKEFQSRRSSYYWLCNAVNTYCPVQWEYSRLNVSYTVVSKRKIGALIEKRICADWDDPRLFTLAALRRRGFTPEAINTFCTRLGVTGANMVLDPTNLEAVVREDLNKNASRTMVVLNPLKIRLTNLAKEVSYDLEVSDFPDEPSRGSHNITFSSVIYIEREDFREITEKNFRRFTPTQSVGIRYAGYVLKCSKVVKNEKGDIVEIEATCEAVSNENKPKAFIHWVSNPVEIEVRLYSRLFKHKNPEDPEEVPGGFLSDVDPNSLKKLSKCLADRSLINVASDMQRFQFERTGFFALDPDSTEEKCVFNRTVTLKEDAGKKAQ